MKNHPMPAIRSRRGARKIAPQLSCNLPRLFLFVELFLGKEIPHRSLK